MVSAHQIWANSVDDNHILKSLQVGGHSLSDDSTNSTHLGLGLIQSLKVKLHTTRLEAPGLQ